MTTCLTIDDLATDLLLYFPIHHLIEHLLIQYPFFSFILSSKRRDNHSSTIDMVISPDKRYIQTNGSRNSCSM